MGRVSMEEEWKDIKGYEGQYQVSNLGRVKSLDRMLTYKTRYGVYQHIQYGKILTPCYDLRGYSYVRLHDLNGKSKGLKIHRLVGLTFIPNPDNLPCLNHKDEIKTNNSVDNLEWCTHLYNNLYGTHLERISRALKGTKRPEEICKKISEAHKGKHLSEATKKKLSELNRGERHPNFGKPRSEETKRKLSIAQKGRKVPEERKQKLREAALRQWERKRAASQTQSIWEG